MPSRHARLALLAVVGSTACGPSSYSSTLELTLEGSFNGAGGVQTLDVSGDVWELPEPDSQCLSCGRAIMPAENVWLLPGFLARGSDPQVDVGFAFDDPFLAAGARLFMQLTVDNAGPPTDLPAILDRVRYTGDAAEPFQATVVVDTTLQGQEPPLVAKGQAELFWNCEYDPVLTGGSTLCTAVSDSMDAQMELVPNANSDDFSGVYLPISNTCDEAVLAPFWERGSVIAVDVGARTYRFDDKEPISCVQTPLGSKACGGSATVDVGGCTWTVDVTGFTFWAKATGCDIETPYCTAILAPCENAVGNCQ